MSDIKVIDNALPENMFSALHHMMYNAVDWVLCYTNVHDLRFSLSNLIENDGTEKTKLFYDIANYIAYNANLGSIIRIRPALIFRDIDYRIHAAHIDRNDAHVVGLLYIDDSDGDTFIYEDEGNVIKQKIEPKQNRLVLFDGKYYHSSSTPVNNQIRMTVNFNFSIKGENNERR
jgi:hypothetical protein